jgi:hypothetical protein
MRQIRPFAISGRPAMDGAALNWKCGVDTRPLAFLGLIWPSLALRVALIRDDESDEAQKGQRPSHNKAMLPRD